VLPFAPKFVASYFPSAISSGASPMTHDLPNHEEWQNEYRLWIEAICTSFGVTPTQIARRIGASPSTITRQIKPGWTRRPQLDILRRIAQSYGQQIPASLIGNATQTQGFSEPDVQPIIRGYDDERDLNLSDWTVRTGVLAAIGCNIGDVLTFDARIKPVAEDVVIAQIYKIGQPGADTVMRYFLPPFLVAAQIGKPTIAPIVVDPEGERVVIMGTMVSRKYERKSGGSLAA
jgi:transcriptional regulator with XRE-family HTH domain